MTDDIGKYPPGYGYAWRGEWGKRISQLFTQRGFHCLTDYARSMPAATLDAMANDLGPGDVAPIQIQWLLIDEAREAGALELCARDLLVRRLQAVPEGWPNGRGWDVQEDVRDELVAWQVSLRDPNYADAMRTMVRELLKSDDIAPGWKPSSTNDPHIAALFERYWPR